MNPGLVVKLRPSGPWRIGPDSGARNRVDVIYHSDSLYSAVTSAMARLGRLEEWLDATARSAAPAVSFSSCFPFMEEVGFVVPPRTVWPPQAMALKAAQVRWKSARFIPLGMVESVLAGDRLDENRWEVDGESGCLVPSGRKGPFRTAVRWSAAVDRLSGASERHSTACIEFRPGAGLWTVVGFADEAARDTWQDGVKAAFRLLADTGFGGERSRGWGRAESPEFIEGELPELILSPRKPQEIREARVTAAPVVEELRVEVETSSELRSDAQAEACATSVEESQSETAPDDNVEAAAPVVEESQSETEPVENVEAAAPVIEESQSQTEPGGAGFSLPSENPEVADPVEAVEPQQAGRPGGLPHHTSHWMLSLFAPGAEDRVDWARGSYTVLARGGRVDSPAGSGELKKQVQMIAEGSVLVAESAPRGAAPDVAPDGFAHPVFRAGFALAIPLPEGN